MSEFEQIPPSILERHPEVVAVHEALQQRRDGLPITAACFHCGTTLVVDEVEIVGVLVVRCPTGDTYVRFKRG